MKDDIRLFFSHVSIFLEGAQKKGDKRNTPRGNSRGSPWGWIVISARLKPLING